MLRYSLLMVAMVILSASNTCGYIVKDGNCSVVSSSMPVVTNFEIEKVRSLIEW